MEDIYKADQEWQKKQAEKIPFQLETFKMAKHGTELVMHFIKNKVPISNQYGVTERAVNGYCAANFLVINRIQREALCENLRGYIKSAVPLVQPTSRPDPNPDSDDEADNPDTYKEPSDDERTSYSPCPDEEDTAVEDAMEGVDEIDLDKQSLTEEDSQPTPGPSSSRE